MTDKQEPEYIIREEDLSCLSDYIEAALVGDESKVRLRKLFNQEFSVMRSRPYHPAPEHHNPGFFAYNEKCNCSVCTDMREAHDERIRKSERKEVLDVIEPICDSCKYLDLLDHCPCEKSIESLRRKSGRLRKVKVR